MVDVKKLLIKLAKGYSAYPVGSVYTSSKNIDPSTIFGGEWELIDKHLACRWVNNLFTFNTTNTQNSSSSILVYDHTIEFRLMWSNKVAINDSDQVIATLDLRKIGLTNNHIFFNLGHNDGLHAIGMINGVMSAPTLTIQSVDWVTRSTSYPTTTGADGRFSMVMVAETRYMIDEFCDKFDYKRVA